LPADKIERAIKKGTGELEGVIYEEVTYEGYGPSGVAILMDIITDNKNRTVAEIRHLLSQFDGNLGENGSVAWMFDKTGQIIMESKSANEDTIFEDAINAGAEDFYVDNNFYLVSTSADQLMEIRDKLDHAGYDIKSAEIIWIISPWMWKKIPKRHLKKKNIVCSVYHIDFENFDKKEKDDFYERDKYVDFYHVISLKTKQQLEKLTKKKIISIPFWVNQDIWFPIENKQGLISVEESVHVLKNLSLKKLYTSFILWIIFL